MVNRVFFHEIKYVMKVGTFTLQNILFKNTALFLTSYTEVAVWEMCTSEI
jgi:hypothetical protein